MEYIEQTKEYRETINKTIKKSRKNIYSKEKRVKDVEMIEQAMKIAHEMQGLEYKEG